MRLCVWPRREVTGYSCPESQVPKFPMVPWKAAFETRYRTDAHVSIYSLEGEDALPRINKPAHQWLIEQGKEPQISWAFMDVDNENHRAWESQEEKQNTVDALVENTFLEDAGIYTTRAGYRLVWRLAAPVLARHWQSWYRQFREHLIANGVPVDTSETLSAWSTSFRLPWVTRDNRPTTPIVDLTPIQDGHTLAWQPVALQVEIGKATGAVDDTQREVVLPTDEEWETLRGAVLASQYMDTLQTGAAIGTTGNRDNALWELIGSIGGHLQTTDPNEIYKFVFESVRADDREGSPTLENAWGKCCRVAQMEAGKVENEERQEQQRERQALLLVHQDRHFYVLDTREEPWQYHPYQFGGNMLVNALERYTRPGVPTIVTRSTRDGPASVRMLTTQYGTAINQVIFVMGQDRAEYSRENGGTLHLGCCVPQPVAAVRDEQIEEWLAIFAGSYLDVLLDWLATLTMLELPTCALYLKGKAGTGKSMLISALASVWGTQATPLQEMMSAFNAGLLECPIVAADEGVTLNKQGSMSPDIVFRNLVANSDHSVNRKNLPVVRVRGCARVVIAANNDRALQFNNSLTEDDLQAIVSRTMYIEAQPESATYLRQLGGRSATADWVTRENKPGKIAGHIAWLAETRKVKYGNRLLVEGRLEDWHRRFIVSVGINSQVLYIIATAIARDGNKKESCFRDGEHILVTTERVLNGWTIYFPNTKVPPPRRIAEALKNIKTGTRRKRVNNQRIHFWEIAWASVEQEIENLGLNLKKNEAPNRV